LPSQLRYTSAALARISDAASVHSWEYARLASSSITRSGDNVNGEVVEGGPLSVVWSAGSVFTAQADTNRMGAIRTEPPSPRS
jgi:hypothetical protein